MAIEKQIWINTLLESFIPDTSFLKEGVDMSHLVEHNKINLAEAGIEPNVLIDNNAYPVPTSSRNDIPKEILLHTFDTENTVVRNVEAMESSYDKMASVVRGHKLAMLRKLSSYTAHHWSPLKNSDFTPVIETNGEANKQNLKSLRFEDFLEMERRFRELDVDMESLVAVLNPIHLADLQSQDLKLYKAILSDKKLFSFKLYSFNNTPLFDTETKQKLAFGAASLDNSTRSSLVFCNTEVVKATGSADMFVSIKDPKERGDIVGFQQRFTALPFRNKYVGSIFSGKI